MISAGKKLNSNVYNIIKCTKLPKVPQNKNITIGVYMYLGPQQTRVDVYLYIYIARTCHITYNNHVLYVLQILDFYIQSITN